jgi:hypothetical protein
MLGAIFDACRMLVAPMTTTDRRAERGKANNA